MISGLFMRLASKFTLLTTVLAAMAVAGVAAAQAGLSNERAGLGLKPSRDAAALPAGLAFGGEPAQAWQMRRPADYASYGGVRELPRLGLQSIESYGGVFYPLSETWGSSLEAGVVQVSLLAPRRYSLSGQLHRALAGGSEFSIGIRYRVYDADFGLRSGATGETTGMTGNGYTLAPLRLPGTSFGQSYQLQLSYQYSASGTFGLALGRDLETFTPFFDVPGNVPRQLTFTGQHWLTPSWALSYDVLSNDPGNPFRVQGLRLGVRYRF